MSNIKRLYFDLETSKMTFWAWDTGKTYLRADQILQEKKIISFHWKWEGEKKVNHVHWGLKKQCDKKVVEEIVKQFNKADEIIAHNGDRFDIKIVYGRAMFHQIQLKPKYITRDTYKMVKNKAYLPSYSLKYCCQHFGLPLKLDSGGSATWDQVQFDKSQEALDHLLYYGDGDIISLEALFNHIRGYYVTKQHYHIDHVDVGDMKLAPTKFFCGECGTLTKWNKSYTTTAGTPKHYMKCRNNSCNTYSVISNRDYMNYIKYCSKNNIK